MYRNILLRYGETRRNGGPPNIVTKILEQFFADLRRLYATQDPKEELALSFMVYDEVEKKLRLVEMIATGTRKLDLNFDLPLGDGLGGAAFKQRRTLIYAYQTIRLTPGGDAYLAPRQGGGGFPYEVLLSSPVFHPRERDISRDRKGAFPDDTVGVISFGSTCPGSALLKLVDENESKGYQLFRWGMPQLIFEAIVDTLLKEVASPETMPSQ
jgi:hypothetical protein